MKTKDTYWFRHDSNAKDDFKCMLVIEQLGCEGYGIFWVLVETLREQKDYRYPLALLGALARKYNTTEAKMTTVVKEYGLFELDKESFFFSKSLNKRMEALDYIKKQRQIAGQKSGESRRNKATKQKLNICSSNDERLEQSLLELKEEEKEDIEKYLKKLQLNEIEFDYEIRNFVDYLIYGKEHKVDSKIFYTKKIKNHLLVRESETLKNFIEFQKEKDLFLYQTKHR